MAEKGSEVFSLSKSKFGTVESFKSSKKLKVANSPNKSDVSSTGLISLKSDETGNVPVEEANVKGCQTKKMDAASMNTEDYLKSQKAENDEFTAANLHAVESLAPFSLRRVYGRLENVAAVNLTGIYKNHVAYATSNVIVIFDYFENSQHCLQGHRNAVTSLVMEKKGRFLVSTDAGVRSLIIVWDIMTGKPVKFLSNVHADHGSVYACFTGVDYIFASIGAEEMSKQTICFWNFDSKHSSSKTPMMTGNFPKTTSNIRELSFLEGKPEFFSATGDRNVIFGTWIRNKKGDSVHFHKPKLRKAFIAKHKRFTSSLWMRNGEWLVTATGSGFVLIWGPPVILGLEDPPDPTKNIREFTRSFKLCEDGITVFTILKDYVVIGDEIGIVRFFDHEFKLLRWSKHFQLPGILSVSFNLTDEVTEFKKQLQGKYDESTKDYLHRGTTCVRDYTLGGKKHQKQLSQTTIPRPPMPCPDFVVGCRGGDVYYYHFKEGQLDKLIPGTPGPFVTCDVCPGSNHVLFSTRKGEIQMYEFKTHQLIFNERIFTGNHKVSTMKFHPMGQFISFGLMDGHVCFRRNYTWKTAIQPLAVTEEQITRIIYTSDGLHMAYYDRDRTVVVSKYLAKGKGWMNLGKSKAHKKDIVDVQFFLDPELGQNRLFSLGLDRHLIEYDIERSSEDTGVFIVKITNLEETCSPTAMVFDGPREFGVDCITFSNDINKLRLFSYQEERVRTTCAGPVFGRNKGINRMIEFPIQMSEDRLKKFVVYIVRNKLGLMDTPVDGNPHKFMAVFTHPRDIIEVAVVPDRERIFTVGRDDNAAFSWEASPRAVEATVLMGGSGVEPFYHTLRRHWGGGCQDIIKDLDMIFFFLNVKRIDKQTEIYSMNRNIRICEIPAVCRACGFFPSEYEVSLMVDEARRLKQHHQHYTDDFTTEFSFDDFVKLFVNHFYRTTDEDVHEAFKILGFDEEDQEEEPYICRKDFIKYLSEEGEAIKPHDFPVYFQPMYEIQEAGKYEDVKCHTYEQESYTESSSSSVVSVSTVSVVNSTGESDSSSSGREHEENQIPQITEDELANEVEEEGVEEIPQAEEDPDKERNSDDDDENNVHKENSVSINSSIQSAKKMSIQQSNTIKENNQQQAASVVAGSIMAASKKSIRLNEITEEFKYDEDNASTKAVDEGEEENEEEEDEFGDDLVDIPERIDLSYFLDIMLPQDCQQTIPWKARTERDSGDGLQASAARQKEEKEFLRTILKQIVDPNFPIPKKLLNTLLAEYYLEHGNFSVPPELRYPGTGIPTSWYNDGDEEEEWTGEGGSSSFTTSTTYTSSPSRPTDTPDTQGQEEEEEGEDQEEEGEDQEEEGEEYGPTPSADLSTMQEEGSTFEEEEEGEHEFRSGHHSRGEEEGGLTTTDGEEEEEGGTYTPPFTVSEVPMSAMMDGHHSDGTEEMTDLDNVYEEEDLEFVRTVNQSFRQSVDATVQDGEKRRKSSAKDDNAVRKSLDAGGKEGENRRKSSAKDDQGIRKSVDTGENRRKSSAKDENAVRKSVDAGGKEGENRRKSSAKEDAPIRKSIDAAGHDEEKRRKSFAKDDNAIRKSVDARGKEEENRRKSSSKDDAPIRKSVDATGQGQGQDGEKRRKSFGKDAPPIRNIMDEGNNRRKSSAKEDAKIRKSVDEGKGHRKKDGWMFHD